MVQLTSTLMIAALAIAPAIASSQGFDAEPLDARARRGATAVRSSPPRRPVGARVMGGWDSMGRAPGSRRALLDDTEDLFARGRVPAAKPPPKAPGRPVKAGGGAKRRVARDLLDDAENLLARGIDEDVFELAARGKPAAARPPPKASAKPLKSAGGAKRRVAREIVDDIDDTLAREIDDEFSELAARAKSRASRVRTLGPGMKKIAGNFKPGKPPATATRIAARDFDDELELAARGGDMPRELVDELEDLLARWAEIDELD